MDLKAVSAHPWRVFAVYAFLTAAIYSMATRFPWRAPLIILPTRWDALIPIWPTAAYVYQTYFLLPPALILLASGRAGFARVLATAMGCGLANAALYALIPTAIASQPAAPAGTLLALIQAMDTPLGAMPSGHVALPVSICVAALLASFRSDVGAESAFWRRLSALFALWAAALAASTLLTKQHYATDAIAGAAFGFAFASAFPPVSRALSSLHAPTALALARDWAVIAAAMAAALAWWSPPVIAAAALVIATRQHAILVLYHDAVHGLIARSRRVNDFAINAAVGVPLLLPVHMYRSLHQSHHAHLGGDLDPERVLLYRGQPWDFRPLPARRLFLQLAGDLLAWNGLVMVARYALESARGVALKLPKGRIYPELAAQFAVFLAGVAAAWTVWPTATPRLLLLWFIPYVTLTQLLQKLRSFAEHTTADVDPSLACSWSPGILGRLTIWPYNINYHREHHVRADVPWDRLPGAFPDARQRAGGDLVSHLWQGRAA